MSQTFRLVCSLFESSQSLFWASFGMVGLETFELEGIKTYTRFWGLLMFGSYSVINVIVLLNLLIAMVRTAINQPVASELYPSFIADVKLLRDDRTTRGHRVEVCSHQTVDVLLRRVGNIAAALQHLPHSKELYEMLPTEEE